MTTNVRAVQKAVANLLDEVRALAKTHRNLSNVALWVASRGRKDTLTDVVTQDEYTHDVTIWYTEDKYLVYDVS